MNAQTTARYGYGNLEAICGETNSGKTTATCPCYTCKELREVSAKFAHILRLAEIRKESEAGF